MGARCRVGEQSVEKLLHIFSDESRDNGGRRLVASESAFVAESCGAHAHKVEIFVKRRKNRREKQQKRVVLRRVGSGFKQIESFVRAKRPVVVFAAAVDAGKGFFVQQAGQSVIVRDLFQRFHDELILVCGDVCGAENGSQLVLRGRDLVVLCFGGDSEFPQLLVEFRHKVAYPVLYRGVILVVFLLSFGRHGSEQRSPREFEVVAAVVVPLVDEKIFLFAAHVGGYAFRIDAENFQQSYSLPVDCLHRTQKGRLFVEGLARVRAEGGGNAQNTRAVARFFMNAGLLQSHTV